jgi:hypothetical protein
MARRLLIALSLLGCASLGTAVDASAATKRKAKVTPAPTVKTITPMSASVGDRLTITGTNFLPGVKKTKVYFMREDNGVVWTRAENATKTRLTVIVPETIIPLLRGTPQARIKTRFQVRILTKRFGAPTRPGKSPLLTAPNAAAPTEPGAPGSPTGPAPAGPETPPDGDCDGDGAKNSVDADDDNDALTDDLELLPAHTDACKADTDGDGVGDGYEYYSAKDMNVAALPYPAKKPWPNPLDSADGFVDHDGDGLNLTDEYLLWKYYGNLSVPLNYSAGLQKSQNELAPTATELAYVDMDGDGTLSDDERDGDGDGLTNWDESHGRMIQEWWEKKYDGTSGTIKETRYPLDYPRTTIFDPDSDGDTVKDGLDDQDHDGLTNQFEVARPGNWMFTWVSWWSDVSYPFAAADTNPWSMVQPYNPCKPVMSHACHLHPPFGWYDVGEPWKGIPRDKAGPQPTAPWNVNGSDGPSVGAILPTIP